MHLDDAVSPESRSDGNRFKSSNIGYYGNIFISSKIFAISFYHRLLITFQRHIILDLDVVVPVIR